MPINFNNGIVNVKGTPGVITDTLANRPNANTVLIGTVFFSTDNNVIYQVHTIGAVQGWAVMGGGGGGTQNLDNVLYQGGQFTNDRLSDLNNFYWELYNVSDFVIRFSDNSYWDFNVNYLRYYNALGNYNLFSVEANTGNVLLGDFYSQFNSCYIQIDQPTNSILFWAESNPVLYLTKNNVSVGDVDQYNNGVYLNVSQNTQSIYTVLGENEQPQINFGFKTQYTERTAILGDYLSDNNKTQISVQDTNKVIVINTSGYVNIGDTLFYGNGTTFSIDDSNSLIQCYDLNAGVPYGIYLNKQNYEFYFGDWINQVHGGTIKILSSGQISTWGILTEIGAVKYGFLTQPNIPITILGDIEGNKTNTKITIDESASPFIITKFYNQDWGLKIYNDDINDNAFNFVELGSNDYYANTNIRLKLSNNNSQFALMSCNEIVLDGNLLSTSNGGNSGQHLKITINNVDYKIKLENP